MRHLLRRGERPDVVTILGLSFKENVPDIRNSKAFDIVRELRSFGVKVQVHDPIASAEEAAGVYGIKLMAESELEPAAAAILAVAHARYVAEGWQLIQRLLRDGRGFVMDVKAKLDRATRPEGIELWRL